MHIEGVRGDDFHEVEHEQVLHVLEGRLFLLVDVGLRLPTSQVALQLLGISTLVSQPLLLVFLHCLSRAHPCRLLVLPHHLIDHLLLL